MKITQLLTEDTINLHLQSKSKDSVLSELVQQLHVAGKLRDKVQFTNDIFNRESQSTTGIGEGIAIPHAKSAAVQTPAIAFGRSTEGIDFDSLDGQPAHLFFMIAASEGANDDHLDALSRLATFLMDTSFRDKIMSAQKQRMYCKRSMKRVGIDDEETEDVQAPRRKSTATLC